MINLTYEYKIEPTDEQAEVMAEWLDICRKTYNYGLAERRDWIKSRKCEINACSIRSEYVMAADAPKITYASQCEGLVKAKANFPDLRKPPSQVLQQTLQILEKAFVGMWEQQRGFPRFKQPGRMRSMLFPQFKESPVIGDNLVLPKLGQIFIRLHRPIPDGFVVKQVRLVRRASGWYAMLVLAMDVSVSDVMPHGEAIGIDVGLDAFVATSEGELINRPKFFVVSQHKLKLLNRQVAKKQKGSKNQQKARLKVARHYEQIANQRKAFHLQVAHHLCDLGGMIFAEDLNLKGLAKGMLAKHCLDAGWGRFLNLLQWVAFKRGVYFTKVDAKGTSQTCPRCLVNVPKDLSIRIHECPECGYTKPRDVASAELVRSRGLAVVAAGGHPVKKSVEQGEETKPAVKQKRSKVTSRSQRHTA